MTVAVASSLAVLVLFFSSGSAAPWADGDLQSTRWSPDPSRAFASVLVEESHQQYSAARWPRQASATLGTKLVFANRAFIVNLEVSDPFPIINGSYFGGNHNIIALDFDYEGERLFWSDVARKVIEVSAFDGTGSHTIVNTGIDTPDGLAWDWVGKNLYWTDAAEHHIEVMDPFETDNRKILITTGDNSIPRAIVVDPHQGWMFWTDWGNSPKIEKASMDGTSRRVLFEADLKWPNGLTLDYDTQTLYWVDAYFHKLESSTTDGSNRQELSILADYLPHPFGLTFHRGYLYWTDWIQNAIITAPVDDAQNGVTVVQKWLRLDPMAIHVISAERQLSGQADERCENTRCSHLCLLSSSGLGYSCVCPQGMILDGDGRTCLYDCNPACEHRGTCTKDGYCECHDGWDGPYHGCRTVECSLSCTNGGTCVTESQTSNSPRCLCINGWTGTLCDIAPCLNCNPMGGTCNEPNKCECFEGYSGDYCNKIYN